MKWLVIVSDELDRATKARAKELGVSASELIRKAVARLLKDPSLAAVAPVGAPKKRVDESITPAKPPA